MTRNLKVLGLALTAMLAIGVWAVSATQATDDTPELTAGKDTVAANQEISLLGTGHNEVFHAFGLSGTCGTTVYGPSASTVKTNSFTLKPYPKDCKAGTLPATVITNECGFQFNIGATEKDVKGQPIPDTYSGTMDIECKNAGEAIELKVWSNKDDHFDAKVADCIVKITAQTKRPGVTLKVETKDKNSHDLVISGSVYSIHAHQVKNGSCLGGTTTGEAEYTFPPGGVTVQASNKGGEGISAWID